MAAKGRKKKLLLAVTGAVLTAAVGAGIWLATRGGGEPVNVYPFEYIGMTEFWGDAQESYGPVTTDKIQTEFLTDTQTITEVAVKDGDPVKKGDVLFSFDTTLDALSLERKRLEVEKIKVQLKAAEERLGEVKQLEPNAPAPEPEPDKEKLGDQLKDPYKISENTVYDGSKPETALICWLKEDTAVSDAILQKLHKTSEEYRMKNAEEDEKKEESSASALPASTSAADLEIEIPDSPVTAQLKIKYIYSGNTTEYEEISETVGKTNYILEIGEFIAHTDDNNEEKTYWFTEARRLSDGKLLPVGELEIPAYPQLSADEQQEWKTLWEKGIELSYKRDVILEGKYQENDQLIEFPEEKQIQLKVGQNAMVVIQSQIHDLPKEPHLRFSVSPADGIFKTSEYGNQFFLMGTPETVTTTPVEYTVTAEYSFDDYSWLIRENYQFSVSVVPEDQIGEFYVVFKSTKDNYQFGQRTTWRGSKVTIFEDGNFELLPFDADALEFDDHMLPPAEEIEIELPEIGIGELYTEEDLLDMQKQLYATIKEQKEKLAVAEKEYDVMQRELGDGNVYAEIDGKVVSLLTEEEARENRQPMIKVSGGGGFYIEGSVSELEKASLKIGQEVTVNDWNTGNMYTGEVVSVSDFPTEEDNWNGMGNPTVAYYPFKAFVSEEADLEAGSYVSVSYSASAAEHGIYLEKPFVRTEKGESYIYVRGADGKLEKRTVRVGKVLWGSYYEILSELSEEDCLAFPYGKNVKQGAPTVESDLSVLYGY